MRNLSFIIYILSAFTAVSCQDQNQGQQQAGGAAPFPVIEVSQRTVTGFTSYPVSIEGIVNSAVRAKVPGYITQVLVDEGEKVSKGQILFKLETESLSQDAGAAKANVNAAQVEVDKLKPLVEKGIISSVQLETAKARLEQAKAGYSSIAASIDYANIKSPVDGNVGAINFREGALVSPGDPTPLTTVSDIDEVYAFFSMNERDYLNFIQNAEGENLSEKIGNFPPVQLQLVNDQIYSELGEIQTVTGQVDPSTGTVGFRAIFPNPNGILASGNSGRIRIPRTYANFPVVPESASFEQQGRVYVYGVQGDSIAISVPIEVVDRVQNLIVVGAGVEPGDMIVAQGVGKLRNNTPIVPQPVSFDSIATSIKPIFK
ncbi:efflux RND transporter periplasmic adaptor subunit [Salinimicrobium terrae]|uniref:efflux RND transporter periplasmic adaptor subunit n=1 Tax=Salinimicrobium terrae TaxID=470866 RepID=UPI0004244803|nr:efflux RND transporter periplasmic adaptor subunit [Salinimicrobium terrae]